jgi:hypothetical protein
MRSPIRVGDDVQWETLEKLARGTVSKVEIVTTITALGVVTTIYIQADSATGHRAYLEADRFSHVRVD